MELQDDVYARIVDLCAEGDQAVQHGQFEQALTLYEKALALVPEPKSDWEAGTWIYTALGDTCYISGDYQAARDYLFQAANCPGGIENPFILLRLGESLYEVGEAAQAKKYLLSAYMLEGYPIFYDEEDKYFDVIKEDI